MNMSKQVSFSKFEQNLLPNFRQKISSAESTEDVKKFFVQTIKKLFEDIFEGKMVVTYEDVKLQPDHHMYYTFSDRIHSSKIFHSVSNKSDLVHVVYRFAEPAVHRYKHLAKSPEKTESKIRM